MVPSVTYFQEAGLQNVTASVESIQEFQGVWRPAGVLLPPPCALLSWTRAWGRTSVAQVFASSLSPRCRRARCLVHPLPPTPFWRLAPPCSISCPTQNSFLPLLSCRRPGRGPCTARLWPCLWLRHAPGSAHTCSIHRVPLLHWQVKRQQRQQQGRQAGAAHQCGCAGRCWRKEFGRRQQQQQRQRQPTLRCWQGSWKQPAAHWNPAAAPALKVCCACGCLFKRPSGHPSLDAGCPGKSNVRVQHACMTGAAWDHGPRALCPLMLMCYCFSACEGVVSGAPESPEMAEPEPSSPPTA